MSDHQSRNAVQNLNVIEEKSHVLPFRDEDFIRGKVPMTKRNVRILSTALLGIPACETFVDIGAGTGGITLEAARQMPRGTVYAIERGAEGCALIRENAIHLGCGNVVVIEGNAPEDLPENLLCDAVFIGGSGKNLDGIISWCRNHLRPGGRLVANFIAIENVAEALSRIRTQFEDVEITQAAFAGGPVREAGLTLMRAENPIFLISATRGNRDPESSQKTESSES